MVVAVTVKGKLITVHTSGRWSFAEQAFRMKAHLNANLVTFNVSLSRVGLSVVLCVIGFFPYTLWVKTSLVA